MSRRVVSSAASEDDSMADLLGSDNEAADGFDSAFSGLTSYKPRNDRPTRRQTATATAPAANSSSSASSRVPSSSALRSATGDPSLDDELGALGLKVQLPTSKRPMAAPAAVSAPPAKLSAGGSFDLSEDLDSYEISAEQLKMNAEIQRSRDSRQRQQKNETDKGNKEEEEKAKELADRRAKYREMKAKRAADRSPSTGNAASPVQPAPAARSAARASASASLFDDDPLPLDTIEKKPASSAVTSSHTSGRGVDSTSSAPPTLEKWYEWLKINPKAPEDKFVLSVANRALRTPLPPHYRFANGSYVNSKTGRKSDKHPLIPHFQKKLEEKRLKLRFGVTDDSDDDEIDLNESELETSREASKSMKSSFDQNPLSPMASPSASHKSKSQPQKQTQQAANPSQPAKEVHPSPAVHVPSAASDSYSDSAASLPTPSASSHSSAPVPSIKPTAYFSSSPNFDEALSAQSARIQALQAEHRAAKLNTPSIPLPPPSSVSGSASESALLATVRSQAARIEYLESRKDSLIHELELAHSNTLSLINEQRIKMQADANDQLARISLEFESYKRARERELQSMQEQVRDAEERNKLAEIRKQQAVQQAIQEAESRAREALDHAVRLQAITLQQQQAHHQREVEAVKSLHHREVEALQQQLADSQFIKALATQIDASSKSIEFLHTKVANERSGFERSSEEQLNIREKLLREQSAQLEAERKSIDNLRATLESIKKDSEYERVRLNEDRAKLSQIQDELKAETSILKDQFLIERETIRNEKSKFNEERERWKVEYARQSSEVELKMQLVERQSKANLQQLEEITAQRADAFAEVDHEREALKEERKLIEMKKLKLIENENALRQREAVHAQGVEELKKKMNEFSELGLKMKAKSDQLQQLAQMIEQEKQAAAKLHAENALVSEEIRTQKQWIEQQSEWMNQQKKSLQKQKLEFLKDQKAGKGNESNQSASIASMPISIQQLAMPAALSPSQRPASGALSPADLALMMQTEPAQPTASHPDSTYFSSSPVLNSSHAALRQALSHLIEDSKRSSSFIDQQQLREWKEEKETANFQ